MKRRKFIAACAAITAMLPLRGTVTTNFPAIDTGFNILLLGDLHYDKIEHHDMVYVKNNSSVGLKEFSNYSRITRDNFPVLMDVVKEQAFAGKAEFILQLGDFVQGMCGSKERASTQLNDFINSIKDKGFSRPFLTIKGNHDFAGAGADEAYIDTIFPWQAKELNRPIQSANVTFVQQNTRFILFDCYAKDSVEWLQKILQDHKEEILIFCCHVPIVPCDERSNLHQYYGNQQKRDILLDLLGKHRAIVLCGHLHKTIILTRNTSQGNFVQVAISSIIRSLQEPIKDSLKGLDSYNADLVNLMPEFSLSSMQVRRDILIKEKPHIRYYEYANFSGYSRLQVKNRNEVILSVFPNISKEPWQTINISKLFNV